jgi:6-pyruvoyltetrahydropterin/6-carboxytetrahydropterin synthase
MILELTQEFYFEAAHTLIREYDSASSRQMHGHTYHAEVTVRGEQDPRTGMIVDLARLREHIAVVRKKLDHRLLDEVPELGRPTIENLAVFIARELGALQPGVASVRVYRKASGDSCLFVVPEARAVIEDRASLNRARF